MIRLYRTPDGWHAQHVSGPDRARIIGLFGTDTLPTAYLNPCEAWRVKRAIEQRNPTQVVVIDGAEPDAEPWNDAAR